MHGINNDLDLFICEDYVAIIIIQIQRNPNFWKTLINMCVTIISYDRKVTLQIQVNLSRNLRF